MGRNHIKILNDNYCNDTTILCFVCSGMVWIWCLCAAVVCIFSILGRLPASPPFVHKELLCELSIWKLKYVILIPCMRPVNMRTIYKLLLTIIIISLFLVFLRWMFSALHYLSSAALFVELVDYFGLPSTIYMPNVSCVGCNQFRAPYLIEPQQTAYCTDDKPIFLMVLVVSQPDNYKQRMSIRRSWGSISAHREKSIRTVFVSGRTANNVTQVMLENEAKQWHDVLQVWFLALFIKYMMYLFHLQFIICFKMSCC